MLRALRDTIEPQNIELKMMNADFFSNLDELVKSLILLDVAHKRLFTKPSTFIIRNSGFGIRYSFNHDLSRFEKKHYPWRDLTHKNILPPDNFL